MAAVATTGTAAAAAATGTGWLPSIWTLNVVAPAVIWSPWASTASTTAAPLTIVAAPLRRSRSRQT